MRGSFNVKNTGYTLPEKETGGKTVCVCVDVCVGEKRFLLFSCVLALQLAAES